MHHFSGKSENIFVAIIILIAIDLLTTGWITWSKFPVAILLIIYFLGFAGTRDRVSRDVIILRERFAKGDISEEEYLGAKKTIEEDIDSHRAAGFRYFFGISIICLGILLISRNFMGFYVPWIPAILILVGLFSIYYNLR